MKNENDGFYYNKIMGNSQQSCKQLFHNKWIAFLDSITLPYNRGTQLRIGNHLRPLLVYWGKALGSKKEDDILNEDVTELAICVEILHKVSIIVDDLIDHDTKRHNKNTFHIQYSPEETIIFAVYMLGKAFEKINILSQKYSNLANSFNNIYAKTLQKMANGCLLELRLTTEQRYDYEKIVSIICMETSTLIKNSLLLGFMTNNPNEQQTIQMIELIGDKVGYLFQTMNDLEPFCSANNLIQHKGNLNMDFEHSRKNIVLPYIYGSCSVLEKKQLLKSDEIDMNIVLNLFEKYRIEERIICDLRNIENELEEDFNVLDNMHINVSTIKDFRKFYADIMDIAKKRLSATSKESID